MADYIQIKNGSEDAIPVVPMPDAIEWKNRTIWRGSITSNSSGLKNLNSCGVDSNSWGIVCQCTTAGKTVSNPIWWNNLYYVVLTNCDSAAPLTNTSINLIVTWFHS